MAEPSRITFQRQRAMGIADSLPFFLSDVKVALQNSETELPQLPSVPRSSLV